MYIYFYFGIFLAGLPALLDDSYYAYRTAASFVVFISPLCLLFIRFKKSDLAIFIYAVILSSLYHAVGNIAGFVLNRSLDVFTLKGVIGSQRYGFVLCLGFFLALYEEKMRPLLKVTCLSILLFGMLLTFSRSTIVALSFAFILLVIVSLPKAVRGRKIRPRSIFRLLTMCVLSIIMAFVFRSQIQRLWLFFDTRLIAAFWDGSLYDQAQSLDTASSEGYRLYVAKQISEFLMDHPLTGSNFSGLYLLFPEYGGSASTHNQYSDVFLRTGLLGFCLYSYLIIKVGSFFRQEKGVLFGLIAILVYGLFHETFKLGYGGFIFGFLLSYQFWSRKEAGGSCNNKAFLATARRGLKVAEEERYPCRQHCRLR